MTLKDLKSKVDNNNKYIWFFSLIIFFMASITWSVLASVQVFHGSWECIEWEKEEIVGAVNLTNCVYDNGQQRCDVAVTIGGGACVREAWVRGVD